MQEHGKFIIKEPCHEDWTQMTPQQQGRFCDVCAKCVVDLTNKSHEQILEAYQENEGNMCGRMKVSQLRSPAKPKTDFLHHPPKGPNQPPNLRWSIAAASLKRIQIFAAAFVAIFAFVFNSQAHAQDRKLKGKVAYVREVGHLEGTVTYDYGSPARGLKVRLMDGENLVKETTTDDKGQYALHDLRPGSYRVTVNAYDWNMTEQAVKVSKNETKTVNLRVFDEAVDGGIEMEPMYLPEEGIIEKQGEIEFIPEEVPTPVEIVEPCEIMMLGDVIFEPINEPPSQELEVTTIEPKRPELAQPEIDPQRHSNPSSSSLVFQYKNLEDEENALSTPGLDLTVYPNPTRGKFSGQVEDVVPSALEVIVLDMQGRILISKTVGKQARGYFEIDLASYSDGVYLLKVMVGDAMEERRIIKAE